MLLLFIMDFDDDEEDYLDFELFEHICVTRTIRDRSNPLIDFSDEEFRVRFRLGKDTVIAILSEIEHDLSYPSGEKNNSMSPLNQLLIALRLVVIGWWFYTTPMTFPMSLTLTFILTSTLVYSIYTIYTTISNPFFRSHGSSVEWESAL